MAIPRQTDPQFKLRLTPELKALVEAASKENNRSINGEIIARLEASFTTPGFDLGKILAENQATYQEHLSALSAERQRLSKINDELEKSLPRALLDGIKSEKNSS